MVMANQETRVVIAAPTFGSALRISMLRNLRKFFTPEEIALRSATDDADKHTECLKKILEQNKPTALIAMDIQPDSNTISAYNIANVPIVLFNEIAAGVSTIAIDNYKGGLIAGEYLLSKGKKKIAIVSGKIKVKCGYNAELRLKGFQQALKAKGLSMPEEYVIEVLHYSREDGIEVMPRLLSMGVDAIFCAAGDNCAQGLLAVASERVVRIPIDVAIVGFDDLPIARLLTPTLTTIRQPLEEMAEAAYNMVVVQRNEILRNPKKVIFNPELVIRKSA
jgi:DNA-binding LacI/PurR family transcriptional regulator